jgi:hypothetical protein
VSRAGAVGVMVLFLTTLTLVLAASSRSADPAPIVQGRDVWRWREIALERDRTARAQARTIRRLRRHVAEPLSPPRVICAVFRGACSEALSVAWCESRFDVNARNGQYRGLFQMGAYARARYGHGPDALTQALAAHAYYLDAGWRPWACA